MNATAHLLPPSVSTIDPSRHSNSPCVEQKPNVWSNGGQMMNLSPPAGDQAAVLGVNSEPLQSSSASNIASTMGSRENGDSWSPDPDKSGDDLGGDPEGVWSSEIEQAFQEALAIYPPCGRRKIILSDEGKMYGRNELIARYIKIRCGKTRTRKQVSSHIQVLARKKAREHHGGKIKTPESASSNCNSSVASGTSQPPAAPVPISMPGSAQAPNSLPAATLSQQKEIEELLSKTTPLIAPGIYPNFFPGIMPRMPGVPQLPVVTSGTFAAFKAEDLKPYSTIGNDVSSLNSFPLFANSLPKGTSPTVIPRPDVNQPMPSSSSLSLQSFTAYVDDGNKRTELMSIRPTTEKPEEISLSVIERFFPDKLSHLYQSSQREAFFLVKCWSTVHFSAGLDAVYAVDSVFTSNSCSNHIKVSTQACSFGKAVVEKIEKFPPTLMNGRKTFQVLRSSMCDYMVTFLTHLKQLNNTDDMNLVLENFTVLQVISDDVTDEVLLVLALMFEVTENEVNSNVFRLVP